jgi:hypothetical protein
MKIGTKSVLFGAHQFAIHPWFVALAWWKLFGFPWDVRLWVAFFVHDLGYLGKPNMDGPEGETHPRLGAKIMKALFGYEWGNFTLLHSRFYARAFGLPYSRLCVADKLATCLTPAWLYLPLVNLTGEIHEYMGAAEHKEGAKYAAMGIEISRGQRHWFESMTGYMRRWVEEHRDGRADTWTPEATHSRRANGVYL